MLFRALSVMSSRDFFVCDNRPSVLRAADSAMPLTWDEICKTGKLVSSHDPENAR